MVGLFTIFQIYVKVAAGFVSKGLKDRPAAQVKASIVPKLDGETWIVGLFDYWLEDDDITRPVKNSINSRRRNGNVSIK